MDGLCAVLVEAEPRAATSCHGLPLRFKFVF